VSYSALNDDKSDSKSLETSDSISVSSLRGKCSWEAAENVKRRYSEVEREVFCTSCLIQA
jgi:hypothetical protein